MEPDELIFEREEIEIEDGRKLYCYSFSSNPDSQTRGETEAIGHGKLRASPTDSEGAEQVK